MRDRFGLLSTSPLAYRVRFSPLLAARGRNVTTRLIRPRGCSGTRNWRSSFLQDIEHGFGFHPSSFDGAIRYPPIWFKRICPRTHTKHSISILQWLLNAETSHSASSPPHCFTCFFIILFSALRSPSRAVLHSTRPQTTKSSWQPRSPKGPGSGGYRRGSPQFQ